MAGDVFQKFKSSVNRGVTTISVKASSSLEKTKIKTHIESIEASIQKLIVDVGEAAYATWESGERDYASLEEMLASIQQKKGEIAKLNVDMASIDERDEKILGNNKAERPAEGPAAGPVEGEIACPSCGTVCGSTARFCRKCGCRLQ